MDLNRIRTMTRERHAELPWWASEFLNELVERVDELEGMLVYRTDENEEFYDVIKWYAGQDNGDRARAITER